jgi:HEAT repeat protein
MAAVRTLGRFEDPRAVSALIAAYQSSDQLTPEPAAMVKCQALNALGETRKADAANFLAEVAKTPLKPDLNDRERGQARDVRLAAVRSLKNFPEFGTATSAAQMLAVGDKDIAVRDRAREAYVAMTGKEPEATPVPGTPKETDAIATVGHTQPKR